MLKYASRSTLSILFFLTAAIAFAQDATVRGFVTDMNSGEPVIFTNVYLKGTDYGATTDVNGYFSITQIPPGDYTLMVTYLGYDSLSESISLEAGQILNKKLELEKSSIEMQEVEVSAERQEDLTKVKMSVNKVTPQEIKSIPTVGGTPDLVQYLQVIPGVVFTGDQGGQLYIRGGTPVQNKVLLDGMTIYNPFHSIGLFSTFNTDIIRNADVYTGGFGPQYGGRISSIMDITTIDGNKKRVSGNVSASTFLAEAMVEGPLGKNEGKGGKSFVFTAKHSYLDESSKTFYDYVDEDGLPYSFTDLYGKLSFSGEGGSKFNLFGFRFEDNVTYQDVSNLNWDAYGGGANFILVPKNAPVFIEGNISASDYQISLDEEAQDPRTSGISDFNMGLAFKYFYGDNELRYGLNISTFSTDLVYENSTGVPIDISTNNTDIGAFAKYKAKIQNLILDLGVRMQYYSSVSTFTLEPRVGLKYNLTEKLRLKAAGGRYTQNLIAANSDRDVVNLFYGFLGGPSNIPDEFTTEDGETKQINSPLQIATHAIAGFEYDLTRKLQFNVEGYYKWFNQMSNINRNKIFPDDDDFIIETGDARGVDFTMKYQTRDIYLWAVYSLMDVDRWDGTRSYDPIFDRRHNVNLVATYKFGEDNLWEVSARWNYGSGFPFTQTQGAYLLEDFSDGINTDLPNGNADEITLQYANLNEGRLPDYHRFDLSFKRTFEFTEFSSLEVNAGVTNIYDRDNVFYVNRITGDVLYQLPIIPSVGMTYKF